MPPRKPQLHGVRTAPLPLENRSSIMIKALSRYNIRYYNPSIISSDDIAEARYTKPMLTTISLPKEEMAKFTVYLLLDRLNGGHKSVTRMELESSLVARSSCFPMKNMDMIEYYI